MHNYELYGVALATLVCVGLMFKFWMRRLDKRFERLESDEKEIKKECIIIGDTFDRIENRLDKLDDRLDKIEERLKRIENNTADLNVRISVVEAISDERGRPGPSASKRVSRITRKRRVDPKQ